MADRMFEVPFAESTNTPLVYVNVHTMGRVKVALDGTNWLVLGSEEGVLASFAQEADAVTEANVWIARINAAK